MESLRKIQSSGHQKLKSGKMKAGSFWWRLENDSSCTWTEKRRRVILLKCSRVRCNHHVYRPRTTNLRMLQQICTILPFLLVICFRRIRARQSSMRKRRTNHHILHPVITPTALPVPRRVGSVHLQTMIITRKKVWIKQGVQKGNHG